MARGRPQRPHPNTFGKKLDPRPTSEPQEDEVARIEKGAKAYATDADHKAMADAPMASPDVNLKDLIKRASNSLALLEAQRKRLDKEEEEITSRSKVLEEVERKVKEDQARLEDLKNLLQERDIAASKRENKLREDEEDLLRQREEIIRRELDADAGFSRRKRDALAQMEAEGEALREQFSRHRKQIDDERAAFEHEMQERRDQVAAELDARRENDARVAAASREAANAEIMRQREELERQREELAAEEKGLRKQKRDLMLDQDLLGEDREAFNEKVHQYAARQIELKQNEIQALNERLDAARTERDRLAKVLAEREEADRRFGGETPDEIMKRLHALEKERERLRKTLGGRPSAEAIKRLEELERQKELWESDRLQLFAELQEMRQEATRKRIAVTELESLRDEKRSLESAKELLHEANRQLRTEVDDLIKGAEGKSPFPSCSKMDLNDEFQSTMPTMETIRSFADFAENMRHRMAWDPKTEKELFYSAEDVRSFLGGLAMSRLHLLQGISGTGKTSLPLAFARAIGAGSALIEVQAGWRDRQDLIGHFNSFERRFYESEFLQALYRASTPLYQDRPFIIVLDEMNLSHPEQYFADLLSALEQDQERQRIVLMTAAVDPAPCLMADGGREMPIPPNVWFVGTACPSGKPA